jgi:hypothetical protein
MAAAAAAAWAAARGLAGRVAVTELFIAWGIATAATELAMAPLVLTRGAGTAVASQAGLVSTLVHLMLSIMPAGAVLLMHLVHDRGMFTAFLLAFYGISLVIVVTACVVAIRQAELHQQQQHGKKT